MHAFAFFYGAHATRTAEPVAHANAQAGEEHVKITKVSKYTWNISKKDISTTLPNINFLIYILLLKDIVADAFRLIHHFMVHVEAMAWSSGKGNNPSKELLTNYDDSSSEDEDELLPVSNIRFCSYEPNELVPSSRARNLSMECKSSVSYESHSNSSVAANKVLNVDCMTSSFSDMKLNKPLNNLPVNSSSSNEPVCPYGHPLERGNINGGSVNDCQQPNTFSPMSNLSEACTSSQFSNQIANQIKDQYLNTASEMEANFPVQQNNLSKSKIITEKNSGMQKIKIEKQPNMQNNPNSHVVNQIFAFLFNNEILSDVHFRVGRGESSQRIPAHKFVLSVGSAVFDAMFNGKLSSQQEEIELPDVEPQAFLALLRFLYRFSIDPNSLLFSDEVQIGPETVMTVLYTAKKYAVPALERQCVEYLKCNLSPDNAFMLLTQFKRQIFCYNKYCNYESLLGSNTSDQNVEVLKLLLAPLYNVSTSSFCHTREKIFEHLWMSMCFTVFKESISNIYKGFIKL
ncbi:BTB/POZ domain-containing protein 2 [Armadillidium vulgare]|nr:BTB/POZ domain-containing protein 2 [Armadillidium vulgare]